MNTPNTGLSDGSLCALTRAPEMPITIARVDCMTSGMPTGVDHRSARARKLPRKLMIRSNWRINATVGVSDAVTGPSNSSARSSVTAITIATGTTEPTTARPYQPLK